jgi:hypothetical protein
MAGSTKAGVMMVVRISGAATAGAATGRGPTPDTHTTQTEAPEASLPVRSG